MPLSLLGEVFQKEFINKEHRLELVTHGITVRVVNVVICKIIALKDVISSG